MATDNEDLLRAGTEAYNRGDLAFILEHSAEDIEIYADPELVNAGTFHGRAAFERWMREWSEAWSKIALDIKRVEEVDDRFLIVDVVQRGTGSGSGIEVEMELTQLIEARDGEIARFQLHARREAAERALAALRGAPERSAPGA